MHKKTKNIALFKSHLTNNEAIFQLLGKIWNENLQSFKNGKLKQNPKRLLSKPGKKRKLEHSSANVTTK